MKLDIDKNLFDEYFGKNWGYEIIAEENYSWNIDEKIHEEIENLLSGNLPNGSTHDKQLLIYAVSKLKDPLNERQWIDRIVENKTIEAEKSSNEYLRFKLLKRSLDKKEGDHYPIPDTLTLQFGQDEKFRFEIVAFPENRTV